MPIKKSLAELLFSGFYIQRWNDKVRPFELAEIEKHGHKMIIAYCLGKYEEDSGKEVDWIELIKMGIFEAIRRFIISDIKSPLFHEIIERREAFSKLNGFVYKQVEPHLTDEFKDLLGEFKEYLDRDPLRKLKKRDDDGKELAEHILRAAHLYASLWELNIIERVDPSTQDITRIKRDITRRLELFCDLIGMRKILTEHKIHGFIDLCGRLRFQNRWSQTCKIPRTSVLGHMFFVACLSFLLTLKLKPKACDKRVYNNFFGGLFHDLPEAVTRDIISPIKSIDDEMKNAIRQVEEEWINEVLEKKFKKSWEGEIRRFIFDEFQSSIMVNGSKQPTSSEDISAKYNDDKYNPYDGFLVKAADKMSAFLEAYVSIQSGVKTEDLRNGFDEIKKREKERTVVNLNFSTFYADFKL
jgi:putative hydrolase of HD superfamily